MKDDLEAAAREFVSATEAVLDWMNGNELCADHANQKPEEYHRMCCALGRIQNVLADLRDNPPSPRFPGMS